MKNPCKRNLADDRSLQLPRKVGVDHGARRSCIQQEFEGANAIDPGLNQNQVPIAQSKLNYVV
jgi:hypothetical protein